MHSNPDITNFDIVKKKGMTADLFAISRFECNIKYINLLCKYSYVKNDIRAEYFVGVACQSPIVKHFSIKIPDLITANSSNFGSFLGVLKMLF